MKISRLRRHAGPIVSGLALAFLPVLAACGGGAAGAAAPEQPLPVTPDATLEAFDRAESDLQLALGPGRQPGSPQAGAAQAAQAPPPAASASPQVAPAAPPPPDAPSQPKKDEEQATSDPCATACRALASMVRAADHLCGLAGDADTRCEGARGRVQGATARVKAQCPACS